MTRLLRLTDHDARRLRRATRGLGLWIGLCAAVIVVVMSALAVVVVLQGQHRAATALLDQAISRADDVGDPPAGVWLVVRGPSGHVATPGLPVGLPDEATLRDTASSGVSSVVDYRANGVEYRVQTSRRGEYTVQAALDLSANHAERTRLALALLLCGGLGLVLAALAGIWLSRRAVQPMANALAVQRQFASDASHELRTPLALLSTRIQMLRRHLTSAGAQEQLLAEADKAVDDAHHLTAILDDLLLAADRSGEQLEPFDLAVLAEQVTDAHRSSAGEVSITTRRPDTAVQVRGAPTAVRRAVTALLDNAVRHAASAVTVTVSAAGHQALLDVVDDGPGIDPDVLPRMFDRFATARSHAVPSPGPRRYGLGLALVSDVAARHGGDVTAETMPGGGTRLRLSLPLDRSR